MQSRRISISKKTSERVSQRNIAALKQAIVEGVKRPQSKHGKRLRKVRQIALYAVAFVAIVSAIAISNDESSEETRANAPMINTVASAELRPTVDQVIEASIIADLAETANLPVATNAANMSTSLAIKHEILQADDVSAISKPQIIDSESLPTGVTGYKVVAGDTVESIAEKNKIDAQTLRWANGIKSDANVSEGQEIVVPSVDGVVYTVKDGDTVSNLADKYKADAERITVFNNLEVDGLKPGQRIIIPKGELPETERPGYVAQRPTVSGGYTYTFRSVAGNDYVYGYCTWYAYERRAQLGLPVRGGWGNAATWAQAAGLQGFTVAKGVPRAGAIFQYGGGYGHVGIVESVNAANGTMIISDMNGIAGWARVGQKEVPINTSWYYIY